MGEKVSTEIDADAYVMVELHINETTVGIKRKNLILQSEKDKMNSSYRKKAGHAQMKVAQIKETIIMSRRKRSLNGFSQGLL